MAQATEQTDALLFDQVEDQVEDDSIDARFARFHKANEHIFDMFRDYAFAAKDAGMNRYSADAILHRIRWNINVETKRAEGQPKINDHYSSRYARMLIDIYPEFDGFFILKKLKS